MSTHVIAIIAFAVICGVWVLLQRWIARSEPEIGMRVEKSSESSCCGKQTGGTCCGGAHHANHNKQSDGDDGIVR